MITDSQYQYVSEKTLKPMLVNVHDGLGNKVASVS
jgi:hypothetical protein